MHARRRRSRPDHVSPVVSEPGRNSSRGRSATGSPAPPARAGVPPLRDPVTSNGRNGGRRACRPAQRRTIPRGRKTTSPGAAQSRRDHRDPPDPGWSRRSQRRRRPRQLPTGDLLWGPLAAEPARGRSQSPRPTTSRSSSAPLPGRRPRECAEWSRSVVERAVRTPAGCDAAVMASSSLGEERPRDARGQRPREPHPTTAADPAPRSGTRPRITSPSGLAVPSTARIARR